MIKFCQSIDFPVYLERSKSGNGGHLWIFFSQSISAAKVREFGFTLLEKAGITDVSKDKSGFDRIFPNQDFLQDGGLGNLIALPLQYYAGQKGNTLFLNPDNNYIPYINQWNFLSNIRKIGEIDIDVFIKKSSVNAPLFLSEKRSPRITISNYISIPIKDIDRQFYQFLRKNLVIHNPIFYEKKAKGLIFLF